MDYRLENLSDDDFEALVNSLCQKVLGIGTVSFSKGKDGGRDARFSGIASKYPSEKIQWSGKFIIQVKHTDNHNASCSDNDFFVNQTSLINKEIPKICFLRDNGEVDNYLLFTNRKESASREDAVKHIQIQTKLTNIDIIGKETLHSWLSQYDDIAKLYKLGLYALPIVLTEFEIKDIIIAFSKQVPKIRSMGIITDEEISAILKEDKNRINNLSKEYYENQIRRRSQQYFEDIDIFLSEFKNEEFTLMYYNFADELSNKIEIKRDTFNKFEEIFMSLHDIIFESNKIEIGKDKRLIWIFLHHLYFNCHIGRTV